MSESPYGPPTHELRYGTGPAGPPRPGPRRRRWLIAVIATAVVVLAAGAAGGYVVTRPEPTITVDGILALQDNSGFDGGTINEPKTTCTATGGYADIQAGAAVVIRNGSGKTLAVGQLGPGATAMDKTVGIATACEFPFSVPDVSAADFYSIEVTHRGQVSYPRAQVEAGVRITLGE